MKWIVAAHMAVEVSLYVSSLLMLPLCSGKLKLLCHNTWPFKIKLFTTLVLELKYLLNEISCWWYEASISEWFPFSLSLMRRCRQMQTVHFPQFWVMIVKQKKVSVIHNSLCLLCFHHTLFNPNISIWSDVFLKLFKPSGGLFLTLVLTAWNF